MSTSQTRGQWSSKLGFILAATGAAVGLGNIWKFPYMVGSHGGSAFVLFYLLCVFALGIPLLIAEIMLGKLGRRNAVDSFRLLAQQHNRSTAWKYLGWWGAATLLMVLAFYSVISGWSIAYLVKSLGGAFAGQDADGISSLWAQYLAQPKQLLLDHTLFMTCTVSVVALGVKSGLERAAKILMPGLLAILIVLVGYASSTPGFNQAVHFLFDFDLSAIDHDVVISALGHALFTLAVGAGAMLVYGSYLADDAPIVQTTLVISVLDLFVAMLAGLAIYPLVFTYGVPADGGPGLMFEALPSAFAHMGGGSFFATLFFTLLLFAAWTSSISLLEPLVSIVIERTRLSRRTAAILLGILAWLLGLPSLLAFNVAHDITLFGSDLFTLMTDTTTNLMLPLGALGIAIFAGWMLPRTLTESALDMRSTAWRRAWHLCLRTVVPVGIVVIMLWGG